MNAIRHWAKINATVVTEEDAIKLAEKFEIIVAPQAALPAHVSAMRAVRQEIKILVYRNGTASRSGQKYARQLYSHDGAGAKITLPDGGLLMNPRSSSWRIAVSEDCSNRLADTGYDGCYVDVLGVAPLSLNYSSAMPIDPSTGVPWEAKDWLQYTSLIGEAVKFGTMSYVVVNGLQNGRRYSDPVAPSSVLLDAVDGGNSEDFVRIARNIPDHYRKELAWLADVDMLREAGSRGKRVFAMTKVWVPATQEKIESLHEYALATFLLGTNGESLFTFYSDEDRMNTVEAVTLDRFDGVDIGMPTGDYSKVGSCYRRSFTKGFVAVNPTSASASVSPDQSYVDLNGDSVTNFSLAPNTGKILLTA